MHFTRVRLENWRNFKAADVPLGKRVFLVGPNASGKSNFLDAFRFLNDVASKGFEKAVDDPPRGGVSKLRSLAARRFPEIAVQVEAANGSGLDRWTYELRFKQDNRGRPLLTREVVTRGDQVLLSRPDAAGRERADLELLRQTHLEQSIANHKFRELAVFFKSTHYLHIVPQLVREPDRSIGHIRDPFGGDFLEQVASTVPKTRDARLRRLRDALRVAVPQLEELELKRDSKGAPHLRGRYEHWRPHAGWQTEEQFSDGTLRLLGLLWALMDGGGPLLLEEPELSLHPEVVFYIPQMMARLQRDGARQILVSTHSSDLLRSDGVGADEVLMLIPAAEGTRIEPAADDEQIRALLEGGMNLAEAVLPRTRPRRVEQLSLFGS